MVVQVVPAAATTTKARVAMVPLLIEHRRQIDRVFVFVWGG
jgi:hypothetical protein